MKNDYAVILVHSTSDALRVEKFLKNAEILCKLNPVPRHLSSDCGIALRFRSIDDEKIRKLFRDAKVEFDKIESL